MVPYSSVYHYSEIAGQLLNYFLADPPNPDVCIHVHHHR